MSLRFRNDHLERVDLALSYSPPLEEVALFKRHTELLRRELGEPMLKECERHVDYDYRFGDPFSSIYDPRGSGSYIIWRWGPPIP